MVIAVSHPRGLQQDLCPDRVARMSGTDPPLPPGAWGGFRLRGTLSFFVKNHLEDKCLVPCFWKCLYASHFTRDRGDGWECGFLLVWFFWVWVMRVAFFFAFRNEMGGMNGWREAEKTGVE